MKIAQIAPVWERVPPRKYGGTELIVSLLTEELTKRGHEVTLFATGDSITRACLVSCYPAPPPRDLMGNLLPELVHTGHAFKFAEQFDIIHDHTGYTGIVLGSLIHKPILNTLHWVFDDSNIPFYETYKDAVFFNSISFEQRRAGPEDLKYIGNVYHSIDIDSYEFSQQKKDFFVHISRICREKGSDIVIDMALKAGVKLIMAGKIDAGYHTLFYNEKVAPKIDGKQIIYKGEVSEEEKRILFRDAKAFIFPLQWAEPFGLVMIEAMASGTPVIAFPFGSASEIIEDGKTGFIVNSAEEMVEAIKNIDRINPEDCRKRAIEKFGINKMVNEYEKIYKNILELSLPKIISNF